MSQEKRKNEEDHSGPSNNKQPKTLNDAFGNLKKSEFFKEQLPPPGQPGTSSSTSRLHNLLVNPKQKGNPLLKFLLKASWEFSDVIPDYVMGRTTCALFLSLRYHQLKPDYIHERLKLLKDSYTLRVLLVVVDVPEPHHALKHLTRICILADLTLMLAWNFEEAGKIIETYKLFENKPPDLIMERGDTAPHQKLSSALTSVRSVNKTDALTLLTTFESLEGIVKATENSLALCPGFGFQKAKRLYKVLHEPFLRSNNNPTK